MSESQIWLSDEHVAVQRGRLKLAHLPDAIDRRQVTDRTAAAPRPGS
ncbi:hypothetical protein [Catellatospora sp. TT07R-123]|nr:hypothetical protein [Catellatospora sp. TT07R-123]